MRDHIIDYEPTRASWLSDKRWQDVVHGASAVNPLGAAGSATIDTATGLLSFSGVADNVAAGVWQMPHGFTPGRAIPHVHLRFPTTSTGSSVWKFEYDVALIDGAFANASGTYTTLSTVTVLNPAATTKHVLAGFGDLDMSSYADSACVLWKLTRLAASSTADDDTNAALLISIDCHIQTQAAGSFTT